MFGCGEIDPLLTMQITKVWFHLHYLCVASCLSRLEDDLSAKGNRSPSKRLSG